MGIIAEGRGDLAVIGNILKGSLGIEYEYVTHLRPEYQQDETDLATQAEESFSNWELVKKECTDYSRIEEFLTSPIDEPRMVIIHIDAAECELSGYDVSRPSGERSPESAEELRRRIAIKIDEWLAGRGTERIHYAIAIEESDAWLLTLFSPQETSKYPSPKETLQRALNRPNIRSTKERKRDFQRNTFDRYNEWSKPFRKTSTLKSAMQRNASLRLFVESLTKNSAPSK
ncbi:hypothetical protein [Corallococcus sp. CA054B]|uniref:hypothetical protein n=1 Tax=Corallococcus sp. CA054B TaxID=2316734 RepID=UPI0011C477B3|nr:hypothetical protein [Corallococcus sp. CA054B]